MSKLYIKHNMQKLLCITRLAVDYLRYWQVNQRWASSYDDVMSLDSGGFSQIKLKVNISVYL